MLSAVTENLNVDTVSIDNHAIGPERPVLSAVTENLNVDTVSIDIPYLVLIVFASVSVQ